LEPAFAARWLIPRQGDFLTLHPNVEIQIDSAMEIRALGRKYCLLESKDRATAKVRGAFHRWIENELGESLRAGLSS
jgi:hypothetical protein